MNAEKGGLSPADTQKIRSGLELCIVTLDHNRKALGETELRLRQQLVQLHAEIEKIDIDSRHPFQGGV